MMKQLFSVAALFGTMATATPSLAAISLEMKYTTINEASIGTQRHDGTLQFVMADNDVKVYDLADGQHTLIATRSSGTGFLFGPVKFGVTLEPNTVDLYGDYISHTLHAHVTTDGQSTCAATITNTLKDGYTVYKYVYPKVGAVDVTKVAISNVSCTFSRIDEKEQDAAVPPVAAASPEATTPEATTPETNTADANGAAVEQQPVVTKHKHVAATHTAHKHHHMVREVYYYDGPYHHRHHSLRAAIRRFMIVNGF